MLKVSNLKKITHIHLYLVVFVLFLYSAIRFKVAFLREFPIGDEQSFIQSLKMFITSGFYEANAYGNSTIFNVISYIFFKITSNELISLRITSLVAGVITVVLSYKYYHKYFSIPLLYKRVAFVTMLNSVAIMSWWFFGINDLLLSVYTLCIFIIIAKHKKGIARSTWTYIILGVLLSLFLLTRKMSILMFPAFGLVLFLLIKGSSLNLKQKMMNFVYLVFSFSIVLLLFNIPSLKEKGTLSYHIKPTESSVANWTHIVYLAAIGEEKGELKYNEYYPLTTVENYIKENGVESLPSSYGEALFFDIGRTIREFFVDTFRLAKPLTRLLGVLFIISLFLFVRGLFKKKMKLKNILSNEIFVFSIVYTLSITLVIIAYVDARWLMNVYYLLPILFCERLFKYTKEVKNGEQIGLVILNVQLLSLIVMALPYLIGNINTLF